VQSHGVPVLCEVLGEVEDEDTQSSMIRCLEKIATMEKGKLLVVLVAVSLLLLLLFVVAVVVVLFGAAYVVCTGKWERLVSWKVHKRVQGNKYDRFESVHKNRINSLVLAEHKHETI